ncbi:uncharacterized protein LOC135842724 [Planococcus citri]|uniref:uncharacterized protein LOC135842724 n=1 Tax=Planococcus citri TaxID=170843 RepID=UPI0031FA26A0
MIYGQKLVKFVVFQILVTTTYYTNGYDCRTGVAGNSSENLRCRLFSNYSSTLKDDSLNDYFQIFDLKIFYADIDVSGIFQLIGDVKAIWEDDQLTWKPIEYNNTYSLDIRNNYQQIWKPEFTLINYVFRENNPLFNSGDYSITVWHNGTVTYCARSVSIQARCPIIIKNRPWFNHTCQLDVKTNPVDILFNIHNQTESSPHQLCNNSAPSLNSSIESPWIVQDYKKVLKDSTYGSNSYDLISIIIELRRNIDVYNSTQCISYPSSKRDEAHCYLFSNPSLRLPPSEAILPTARIQITYVDFNIEDGILLLNGRLYWYWVDERVDWVPKKLIKLRYELDVVRDSVWKPSLTLHNELFQEEYLLNNESFSRGVFTLTQFGGIVLWWRRMSSHIRCDIKYNSWPWDPQKCALNFTFDTPSMHIDLSMIDEEIQKRREAKSLWTITNVKKEINFPNLIFEITFELKNHSSHVVLCLTFIALSVLTLTSFLISPMSTIKLASKITSLLLLVIFITMMMNSIPNFAVRAPNFLIGFVVLLLTVGISSCITAYIVQLAIKSQSYHPSLIMKSTNSDENKSFNDAVEATVSEDITQTEDEYVSEDSLSKKTQDEWLKIASFIEYSSFAISLIVALILTMSLII